MKIKCFYAMLLFMLSLSKEIRNKIVILQNETTFARFEYDGLDFETFIPPAIFLNYLTLD